MDASSPEALPQCLSWNKKYADLGLHRLFKPVDPFFHRRLQYLPSEFATYPGPVPSCHFMRSTWSNDVWKFSDVKSLAEVRCRADDEVDVDGTVEEDLGKSRGSRTDDSVLLKLAYNPWEPIGRVASLSSLLQRPRSTLNLNRWKIRPWGSSYVHT